MDIFTKTLASSFLASIFIINGPIAADEIYLEPAMYEDVIAPSNQDDEESEAEVERSIVVKAKQGKPIAVIIDEDGIVHQLQFTQAELADMALINEKLKGLNRETLSRVRSTLVSVNKGLAKMKGLDDDSQIIVNLDGDDVDTDVDFNFDFDFAELEKLKTLANLDKMDKLKELEKLSEIEDLAHLSKLEGLKELEKLGELKEVKVLEKLMSKEHAQAIRQRVRIEHRHEQREKALEAEHMRREKQIEAAERRLEAAHEQRERAMEKHQHASEERMAAAEARIEAAREKLEHAKEHMKRRMVIVDGEKSRVFINSDEAHDIQVHKFKLDGDNVVLKGHVDAILKLIAHGEFTPEELDKLQQLLDSKR